MERTTWPLRSSEGSGIGRADVSPGGKGSATAEVEPSMRDGPPPADFGTNIHVTISGNFGDHALHTAPLSIGADAILYSVDHPFADPRAGADWLDRAPISEAGRAKIAHGNAQRMFRIPDSAFVR
ncbi:amidohydrolase family protein [Streptomyces platensis]|uniref:amidohydrolase family protein n=1 Tax=Streptomyces platensis TaxID=58346 RepID=UPI00331D892E